MQLQRLSCRLTVIIKPFYSALSDRGARRTRHETDRFREFASSVDHNARGCSPCLPRARRGLPCPHLLLAPAPVLCVWRPEGTGEERARCLLSPCAAHLACPPPRQQNGWNRSKKEMSVSQSIFNGLSWFYPRWPSSTFSYPYVVLFQQN